MDAIALQYHIKHAIQTKNVRSLENCLKKIIIFSKENNGDSMNCFYFILRHTYQIMNSFYLQNQPLQCSEDLLWLEKILPSNHFFHPVLLRLKAAIAFYQGNLVDAIKYSRLTLRHYLIFLQKPELKELIGASHFMYMLRETCIVESLDFTGIPFALQDLILPKTLQNYDPQYPLITAYGNSPYFQYYSERFLKVLDNLSPNIHCLLVIGDLDAESQALAEKLQAQYPNFHYTDDPIAKTFQDPEKLPTFCSFRRFTYMEQILDFIPNLHLITLDLDLFLHSDFSKIIDYTRNTPLSYHSGNAVFEPLNVFAGGLISLCDGKIARNFTKHVNDYLQKKMNEPRIFWIMDQYALFYGYQYLSLEERKLCKNISDITNFSLSHLGSNVAENEMFAQDKNMKADQRFSPDLLKNCNILLEPETLKPKFIPYS